MPFWISTLLMELVAGLRLWFNDDNIRQEAHRRELIAFFFHLERRDYAAALELLTFSPRFEDVRLVDQLVEDALAHGITREILGALAERFFLYADILEYDDRYEEVGPRITAVRFALEGASR